MSGLAHRVAGALVGLAAAILPPALRSWGAAMRHEIAAIASGREAIAFALGCIGVALHAAFAAPASARAGDLSQTEQLPMRPQAGTRRIAALCAIAATGLGLGYLALAGAPPGYLAMNAAALAIGFLAVGIIGAWPAAIRLSPDLMLLALGCALLAASLFGTNMGGATRWVSIGGLSVQLSLIVLPVMALGFARNRTPAATMAIMLAAAALALQPDRAMAGALTAAMLAIVLVRPDRNALFALTAGGAAFAATLAQPDTQPAMPWVDQIFHTAFAAHPLAGVALYAGAAVMLVPALFGWARDPANRAVHAALGALWLAMLVAAALGNYPTPVIGYGGSAIVGYVIAALAMPRRRRPEATPLHDATAPAFSSDEDVSPLRAAIRTLRGVPSA